MRCPLCNALMYERIIKKGALKGEKGWGCPCCFKLLSSCDELSDELIIDVNILTNKQLAALLYMCDDINKKDNDIDDNFDFWCGKDPENPDDFKQ